MLVRHAAVIATAVVALAGCAAAQPAEPTPVLLDSTDLRLPLDDYLLSQKDLDTLGRARVVWLRECMGEAGFDFPPAPEQVDTGLRSWNERRYGITDEELAAVDGYGLGARDPAARPPLPRPTPEQRAALEGPDGCLEHTEAQQRRDSPPDVDRGLPQRLSTESFTRSRGAPRVRAVLESWSECMRAKDYAYADPLAAASDERFTGRVTPVELAVAAADIECKRKTNLVGVWFSAEQEIQRDLVAANRAALADVRQANTAEIDRARHVVGT